jgi:hypothetical protein
LAVVTGFLAGALLAGFLGAAGFEATFSLAGFFDVDPLAEGDFFRSCVFFVVADFVFFFSTGFATLFLAAGLDLTRAAGLAFPWAAFFFVLLDLLTV